MQPRRPAFALLAGLALALLAGCGGADRAARGGFPALLPLDALLAEPASRLGADGGAGLAARAAGLRARAATLRDPVLEPPVRRRMLAALARQAGG